MASPSSSASEGPVRLLAPGLLLSVGVALAAFFLEPAMKAMGSGRIALPAMVIALIIGIGLHGLARQPRFEPGITYAVKKLLRYAIALLGLRIAFSDLAALGWGTAVLVIIAMVATVASGFALARVLGREAGYGALAGAATAICGASATLATATVVPDYKTKSADIAFTVVMANGISTLVMIAYPPLCAALGLSPQETGVMLGLTIHDMAQVVGAGYAVSEPVGNTAVIVKLFRVFLLLPAVLLIGMWFVRKDAAAGITDVAKVPIPVFAVVFLGLAILNSILPSTALADLYVPVKSWLSEASKWGLLISIAALGLGTSIGAVLTIGWRHIAVFIGATGVLLAIALGGILLLR
ncbi:MAG: hypothetical protein FD175_659 [Beijerinckiaceae bacterium]|nr:MAG: hypothetical protein FD175_659 [Beijerinckiaceae bacterium]